MIGIAKKDTLWLDYPSFDPKNARAMLDEIDRSEAPLLRLWRWPGAYRCVFCISADICAIDLKDFIDRTRNF
jgi:hypothetical protein